MISQSASSLRGVEDLVEQTLPEKDRCFRGQSDASWSLVPSAYRALIPFASSPDFDPGWVAELERDTYREFEIEAWRELGGLDVLERLSRAQHHGVPTRLLDWTANVGVACYFAVSGAGRSDAAVWCLNLTDFPFPLELGRQHRGGGHRLKNITNFDRGFFASFAQPVSQPIVRDGSGQDHPLEDDSDRPSSTFIVWKPHRVDERLRRQEGLLSWYHSFDDDDLVWNYSEYITLLEHAHQSELLVKITIPAGKCAVVLEEIIGRGINEHHLFADLDGLGKYLARTHYETVQHNAKT